MSIYKQVSDECIQVIYFVYDRYGVPLPDSIAPFNTSAGFAEKELHDYQYGQSMSECLLTEASICFEFPSSCMGVTFFVLIYLIIQGFCFSRRAKKLVESCKAVTK